MRVPEGVDGTKMLAILREEHDVTLAGSYGELRGKMFRIGHLGYVTREEIQEMLDALGATLRKLGFTPSG